jgi:metallophosphoesterase (TIGR03767 family)
MEGEPSRDVQLAATDPAGRSRDSDPVVTLTRRRMVQVGATSAGAMVIWPSAVLLGAPARATARHPEGTTLESALAPRGGHGYRRLHHVGPWDALVREELATGRRGREDRREGLGTVVQISDLHVTDVQNPMRFEYVDRINRTGHRPQELLGVHGADALVRRINGIKAGPFTGRPVDAVMSTGDNTDNQARIELEWLLGVLAGGIVEPDSGTPEGFEGVAGSGLTEYWQPESTRDDRYKQHGFPVVPDLLAAATRPFRAGGLDVPWLLTTGNHDAVANGMLENLPYVEEWCGGGRKVFSSHCDATLTLAARLGRVRAGDDVGDLIETIARAGQTRSVQADERRLPLSGDDYVGLLHDPRFAGAGPVGHGYASDTTADRLYYSHPVAPQVVAISLDTTNQAGGFTGSVGTTQLQWLARELSAARDSYVVVFSHHPSNAMDNLAVDPRTPKDKRHDGQELIDFLHEFPQVVAWVNGHSHCNEITAHQHSDPRRSFWEINSASHVDAPQQARIVELASNRDGTVSLFTTMIDADSPAESAYDDLSPRGLASLYRELAYNDPAYLDRRGRPSDRNTELLLVDPLGT